MGDNKCFVFTNGRWEFGLIIEDRISSGYDGHIVEVEDNNFGFMQEWSNCNQKWLLNLNI